MVTASHNPPQDNGYKVYLGDGAQIAPPADEQIAAAIERVGAPVDLPLGDGGEPVDVAEDYLAAILAALPAADARDVRIVYTPLHGVGARAVPRGARRAPASRRRTSSRRRRSPTPTSRPSPRPNPEEAGTLDLALAAAAAQRRRRAARQRPRRRPAGRRRSRARTAGAACTATRSARCWPTSCSSTARTRRRALLVTTVASSTLLGRMAEAAGARYAETLTGFKWMMRAVAEAPGARAAARLRGGARLRGLRRRARQGRHLGGARDGPARGDREARRAHAQDRLEAIAARYGAHATDQVTLELEGADGPQRMRGDHGRAARASRPRRCSGARSSRSTTWRRERRAAARPTC